MPARMTTQAPKPQTHHPARPCHPPGPKPSTCQPAKHTNRDARQASPRAHQPEYPASHHQPAKTHQVHHRHRKPVPPSHTTGPQTINTPTGPQTHHQAAHQAQPPGPVNPRNIKTIAPGRPPPGHKPPTSPKSRDNTHATESRPQNPGHRIQHQGRLESGPPGVCWNYQAGWTSEQTGTIRASWNYQNRAAGHSSSKILH